MCLCVLYFSLVVRLDPSLRACSRLELSLVLQHLARTQFESLEDLPLQIFLKSVFWWLFLRHVESGDPKAFSVRDPFHQVF